MPNHFTNLDWLVLLGYFGAIIAVGLWFRREGSVDGFTAGNRALSGWALGLSMFGSYISSISFLANPGSSYAENWNAFVFSLATPLAAAIAVGWFVPFYRRIGAVSAYEHFEHRFGPWARTYAVVCFLLVQMARMGTVMYLLALAISPITGWEVEKMILVTGTVMTLYTFFGGIKAVVWAGVLQSTVLIAGTLVCLTAVVYSTTGGVEEIIRTGVAQHKFSLGSFGWSLSEPTFWVVLLYGVVINVNNFAVDQSYVQRYITARSDADARKSVWLTAGLYVPVAAIFFFIGTSLFVFYHQRPELVPSISKGDAVLPHFISTQLPMGLAGLVVAAVCAASMDPNLNSMATLTYLDIYKRYFRPHASERESLVVLRTATLAWGAISMIVGLAMIQAERVLDAWWQLAGIFSGGVLGLFLLGMLCPPAKRAAAASGVVLGVLVIAWMVFSPMYWGRIDPNARVADSRLQTLVLDVDVDERLGIGDTVHVQYSWRDADNDARKSEETHRVAALRRNGQELELSAPLQYQPTGAVAVFDDSVWYHLRSPFHNYLTIVIGTAVVLGTGCVVGTIGQMITRLRSRGCGLKD
jgi:SSS family solute:Na+ symporter